MRVIKLTAVTMLLFSLHLGARSVSQTVSFSGDNVPLKKVFTVITQQTGFVIVGNKQLLQTAKRVCIHVKNIPLLEFLDSVFSNQPLTFVIIEKTIVIKPLPRIDVRTYAKLDLPVIPPIDITGKITDNTGQPLSGVSIVVRGSSTGTVTNSNGEFKIQISGPSAVLLISYTGFINREVLVDQQKTINVSLVRLENELQNVVVVGYGTQRKKDVTGAVANVSMANIKEMSVTGVDQALSGQIAGLQISTSNGIPGGGPQVQLRGVGAIGAISQPLYVVDGYALSSTSSQISNPMNDIAPQDIQSITVLKDASATAIYGSRGANGVIIITTKSGTSGEPKVQISAYTGMQVLPQRADPNLMNAQEFAAFKKESISDQILANTGQEATIDQIPEIYRNPEKLGKGTNWFDVITQVAPLNNINFSLSGGNDKVRTYISAGYLKQEGVVISTGYERYSLRANVDANISKKLKVGINVAPTFTKRGKLVTGGAGRGEQGFGEALVASPIPAVYKADGTYNAMIQEDPGIFPYPNPLMALKEIDDNSQSTRILFSAFGEYSLLKNLKIRSTINADWQEAQRNFFHPSTVGYLFQFPPTIPTATNTGYSYLNLLNENTITYQSTFGNGHSVTALAGYSIQHETTTGSNFIGDNFPDDDVRTFNAAARITGSTSVEEWALMSYLARVNYSFQDKYLITATMRRDGSSRFGEDNRWGDFPSLAVGWHLSKEPFMQNVGWLSDLKLRASYGRSGNFQIGNYTYMSQIVSSNYVLGDNLVGGRIMNSLGNPILGWEKMRETNLGIDVALWNNRVYVTADVYKRNTEDLLLNAELPRSSGFSRAIENHGNIQNKGIELSISSRNIDQKSFTWITDFNIAFNRNKVLALGATNAPILAGSSYEGNPTNITMVGQPLGQFYGFVFDGIYQTQADIDKGPTFPGAVPGNMRVKDINGNGVINDIEDFAVIGNSYPDFIWGITNTVTFKNFDLRVSATSQVGGSKISTNQFTTHLLDGLFNVSRDLNDRWRSPSQPGNGKVPTTNGTGYGRRMYRDINSLFVENNTYFWIKNITLGYNFPKGIAGGRIKTARFYASIQNGLLFTKYSGNPEVTSYVEGGSALTPGYDSNPYPVPVIYSIGTNLSF
jgi:TonB-linked SusC/RagA family outer membrane protein